MKGNTNAGGVSVGNESAIDLLKLQNEAKTDLAENLQGKGISADASSETLEQLVGKVADISSDSSAELVPCVVTNNKQTENISAGALDGSNSYSLKYNGYLFQVGKGKSDLKYVKLSDIENDSTFDNASTSATAYVKTLPLGVVISRNTANIAGAKMLSISKNGSKLFIASGYATSYDINLIVLDLQWNDDELVSIEINKKVGVKDSSDTAQQLMSISANSDGTKVLCFMYGDANTHKVFLYDVENETTTQITGIKNRTYIVAGTFVVVWVGDNEFVTIYLQSAFYTIDQYSLDGTVATALTENSVIMPVSDYVSDLIRSWEYSFNVVEYETGKCKILLPCCNKMQQDEFYLGVYDSNTKTFTKYKRHFYFGRYTGGSTFSVIDVKETENYYIVFYLGFYIFDKNWNLVINNTVNYLSVVADTGELKSCYWQRLNLIGEKRIIAVSPIVNDNACSFPYWLNKKGLVKRTKSIDGVAKELYYPTVDVTADNVNDGYFD